MLFEGVLGIGGGWFLRLWLCVDVVSVLLDGGLEESSAEGVGCEGSGVVEGSGGGKGEMEMFVTEAEWAW